MMLDLSEEEQEEVTYRVVRTRYIKYRVSSQRLVEGRVTRKERL